MTRPRRLTEALFHRGLVYLEHRDRDLAEILRKFGPPPMWVREPGFLTLVQIILEQQVSLASAKAAFDRLLEAVPSLTPEQFLQVDNMKLKQVGFSRQKTNYCRNLAHAIVTGQLNLSQLDRKRDEDVRAELIRLKGIGRWTADIYLLMGLRRPDILPGSDLALAIALQKVKRLKTRPTPVEIVALGKQWKPWRAVAARILWHYYLSTE